MILLAHFSRLLGRLARPLMLVCVMMIAFGPVADSLICGLEPGTVEAAALDGGHDGGDAGAGDAGHAVCAHGHCHHSSALTGEDVQLAAAVPAASIPEGLAAPRPPSANQPTLERPPRV